MPRKMLYLLTVLLPLFWIAHVQAQGESLRLTLSRDWGYGGGRDIQGLFSLKASGPADLERVAFYLDDTLLAEDTEPPFRVRFNTDDYPLGEHTLSAVGYTKSGQRLEASPIRVNFVSAEVGWKTAGQIIGLVFVVILAGMVLSLLLPISRRGRAAATLPPGTPRAYPLGGGICPQCQRPFAFHLWGLNLLAGKFDRCPYCGRWGLVQRRSLEELRAAERAELERAQTPLPDAMSEEERLKRSLDESRYQDL